jgi:DNA-binding beta-propeller fold protein YncE
MWIVLLLLAIDLPGGRPGIGFDDLQYSPRLQKVLAPGGRSGKLFLIDPKTNAVTAIGGFSTAKTFDGGHDFGITSVADTGSALVVTDRTSGELVFVTGDTIASRSKLAAAPDYVRWVPATKELWVTEPDADQIEVFDAAGTSRATIAVKGGPESLVIAGTTAYTHLWKGKTVEIDVKARRIVAAYPNGCESSRGIAFDEAKGFLFAGCADGTVTVLKAGKLVAKAKPIDGQDIIAWSPAKRHLYLAGSRSKDMAIVAVGKDGSLKVVGKGEGAAGGHCVTTDDAGHAFVCDPGHGRLIANADTY